MYGLSLSHSPHPANVMASMEISPKAAMVTLLEMSAQTATQNPLIYYKVPTLQLNLKTAMQLGLSADTEDSTFTGMGLRKRWHLGKDSRLTQQVKWEGATPRNWNPGKEEETLASRWGKWDNADPAGGWWWRTRPTATAHVKGNEKPLQRFKEAAGTVRKFTQPILRTTRR